HEEREKLAKKFISGAGGASDGDETGEREVNRVAVTIRLPAYYIKDVARIKRLTGQTLNATYIELLRDAIKQKLKDLEG
ncbi:MAG TPA: hypothetical protein VJ279_11915, partial [Hanamia sp.]|nr:hypothetical protein [Hanamia sp.]